MTINIITKILTIFAIVFASSTSIARGGGDLGGGGAMKKDFKLDQKRLELLKAQSELTEAQKVWLETITDKELEQLVQKVFKHHIAPQIVE